jgi:uncharacterized membrane protein YbhN (UPF0104 family)
MRQVVLRKIVSAVTVVCVTWVLLTFNWPDVWRSLALMDFSYFISVNVATLTVALGLRALRWMTLTAMPRTWGNLGHSMLVNGFASGLAAVTPFQLGELIKARFLPEGDRLRVALPVLVVERALDAGCLVSLGVLSLLWRYGYAIWMGLYVFLVAAGVAATLALAQSRWLKARETMRWLSDSRISSKAFLMALAISILMWLVYTLMWWLTARSMGVDLSPLQTAALISSVMLAIAATLAPSGLGVSEITSSGVLLWYGYSASVAESVAMALRMLTPLMAGTTVLCGSLLWLGRHFSGRGARG